MNKSQSKAKNKDKDVNIDPIKNVELKEWSSEEWKNSVPKREIDSCCKRACRVFHAPTLGTPSIWRKTSPLNLAACQWIFPYSSPGNPCQPQPGWPASLLWMKDDIWLKQGKERGGGRKITTVSEYLPLWQRKFFLTSKVHW